MTVDQALINRVCKRVGWDYWTGVEEPIQGTPLARGRHYGERISYDSLDDAMAVAEVAGLRVMEFRKFSSGWACGADKVVNWYGRKSFYVDDADTPAHALWLALDKAMEEETDERD